MRLHFPYRLDGRTVGVASLGFKNFVVYRGRRVGPLFDDVFLATCCEGVLYSVSYGDGSYLFRGKRGGEAYLVLLSVMEE